MSWMQTKTHAAWPLIASLVAGCGGTSTVTTPDTTPTTPTLATQVDALLDDSRFQNNFWGVQIVGLDDGEVLFERNARRSFVPASNMKLYSSAAGLDQLGPEFAWRTEVLIDGPVTDDTLDGSVIVRGSGDPTIGGRFDGGDLTSTFRQWADSLKSAGITVVAGDVIGDDNAFDDIPLGSGWMWDDESTWYSAEIGALTFNDNCVDVTVAGLETGHTADVYWEPYQTDYVDVINLTETVHPDSASESMYRRLRASNTIEIKTRVRPDQAITRSISISNPTKYFVHVFREVLEEEGVVVLGDPVDIDELYHPRNADNPNLQVVATRISPALDTVAAVINKPSHNLYAEQLLKTLGRRMACPGEAPTCRSEDGSAVGNRMSGVGSGAAGAEAVIETLVRAGVDTSSVVIADGSGLSRYNMITPEGTVRLLAYMWSHPDRSVSEAFVASLPVGGIDGTTKSLITSGPAVGNLRAKTGTMTGVRALSGYITSSSGRPLAFSLISNHHTVPTSDVNDVQRALADLLARL